jgi:hypothetical protein
MVLNVSSKIHGYLRLLRWPAAEINIVPLMNIKSLEMQKKDRLLLLRMFAASTKRTSFAGKDTPIGFSTRS